MLLVTRLHPASSDTPQSGIVMSLPSIVGVTMPNQTAAQFYGLKAPISDGELGILPSDTELLRKQYGDVRGNESILCTLLLSGAEQRSIHRAEVCLAGQGWTVVDQEDVPVPLGSGHKFVVRKLGIQRDSVSRDGQHHIVHALFMYWFVGENITTSSHVMRVLLNSWDRIVYNRAHRWAYIMVMAPVSDSLRPGGLNAAQTQPMMTNFISQVVPSFEKSEMPAQAPH